MRGRLGGTALCAAYGAVHALVDAVTVSTLFIALSRHGAGPSARWTFVVAYNAIVFGLQPLIGLAADASRRPRVLVLAGLAFAATGLFLSGVSLLAAVAVAAAGNALFHVGAGALSILATPGRTAGPGIFTAPGALGLALGTYLGMKGILPTPFFSALLALSIGFVLILPPKAGYESAEPAKAADGGLRGEPWREAAPRIGVFLLLSAIVLRAVIGTVSKHGMERSIVSLIALPIAAAAGKALGGIVADRAGRLKTAAAALAVSAPLIAFARGNVAVLAAGAFLFQAVMPITLGALASAMPRRPGLAFGLNCLALFFGFLVTAFPSRFAFQGAAILLCVCLGAAGLAAAGIRLTGRTVSPRAPHRNAA